MSSWVDNFKKLAISSSKQHIIVADVDGLFDYPELKQVFEDEGFHLILCKTNLDVRIQFELNVNTADRRFLIIAPANYQPLPDMESIVHFQDIGLRNLFPNLDAKAIQGLSYNALCLVSNIKNYEELGHEKTIKFLIENLYNVDLDALTKNRTKERIINALITVLLEKNGINPSINDFLVRMAKPSFPVVVSQGLTRTNLVDFIQNQWLSFVEGNSPELNFSDPILSRWLGYLVAFEYLFPVKVSQDKYSTFPKELRIGLFVDEVAQIDQELEGLNDYLLQQLENIEDDADQWFRIVQILANAKTKAIASGNSSLKENFLKVELSFNNRFQRFIDNVYNSLFTLSGVRKPVVVSRILEHMKASPARKKAILVIDGMNYWQWALLHQGLTGNNIKCQQSASLAYIPTITAWSRQAIFKGDKPDLQEDNSKESKLFETYWSKQGIPNFQIDFHYFDVNTPLAAASISKDTCILGLVCNDLDNLMHGTILGDDQLKLVTQQWIDKSNIVGTLSELVNNGFQVFITADHGNVEATGIKNLTLKDKVGAKSRGKRHLYFTNDTMLDSFMTLNPDLAFGRKGLSIFLRNKDAFSTENEKVVTHGGSHFWEVIVPFIRIDEQ